MYVQGFVVPVPGDQKEAYKTIAESFWEIAKDYGAVEHVEAWEVDVKDGHTTDFRTAVKAEPGEKIVFSWVLFESKEAADASHDKMMADPRMAEFGSDMPFDGKRMIYAGFEPLVWKGRTDAA